MEPINPLLLVQKTVIDENALKFKTPLLCCIAGPSMSGKSEMLFSLVQFQKDVFSSQFQRIIYCEPHSLKNPEFFLRLKKEFPQIEHCYGLPNLTNLNLMNNSLPCMILIDDLMVELLSSEEMLNLATKHVHHLNLTVFVTTQNYFGSTNKYGRTFIKNCQYKIFFYNRVDQREINLISSQIANSSRFFASNFEFLFKRFPNSYTHYLLIDGQFHSSTKDFWCRSNIFPESKGGEIKPIVFFKNPNYHK
jgi:hypothetical protein